MLRGIATSKILEVAESMGIKSGQKGINPQIVEKYYQQMLDGTYKSTGGGGFIHNGKVILTEGNHRMNAAIKYGIEHGNFKYADELISNGRFTTANPANYGVKTYKLPVK